MKIHLIISMIITFCVSSSLAQKKDINYYLPKINYDKNIPTPEEVLGYQVGEWHVSHDQLVSYMKVLADKSDRITIQEYARTHENRPLLLLTITNPANHNNIEKIRKEHVARCGLGTNKKDDDGPLVIYQGYSIHGNESSGSNAGLLVAYYLAAGQSDYHDELLENTVILLDPCYNPDGFNRFASWVNSHKSKNMSPDPEGRELNEAWPGGRTNHYWFDLNRDWLLLSHPESRGRVKMFHHWKPNVLTDHHEMGSNSTFFFMPGIPSRTNPLTPSINQEITGDLALFHAAALDSVSSSYYTRESFDDYYHGKGSTYPDANGCVGILFEQASSRGHLHSTENGLLAFPFTIKNQVITSLSTQKGALHHRKKLLKYQREFYQDAPNRARKSGTKAYAFGAKNDFPKLKRFIQMLDIHDIEVYRSDNEMTIDGIKMAKGESFVVPTNQAQFTMINTIFETQFGFTDSLFYDVSAWTVPMALDLNVKKVSSLSNTKKLEVHSFLSETNGNISAKPSKVGYVLDWSSFESAAALYQIQSAGLITKLSDEAFTMKSLDGTQNFKAGSIIIPVQNQGYNNQEIYEILKNISDNYEVTITSLATGLSDQGLSMGSRSHTNLEKPKVVIFGGSGANSYEVGAAWYVFDQLMDISVTVADQHDFNDNRLSKYNVIVLADGNYSLDAAKIKKWVSEGGTLISMKRSGNWVKNNIVSSLVTKSKPKAKKDAKPVQFHYCNIDEHSGAQVTGGCILSAKADLTNPLCFGLTDENIHFMRRGNLFFEPTKNAYATPIRYTSAPLASGYMAKQNQELAKEAAAVITAAHGSGKVIVFGDNPNFRGYWLGGMKVFLNAVFFGQALHSRTLER